MALAIVPQQPKEFKDETVPFATKEDHIAPYEWLSKQPKLFKEESTIAFPPKNVEEDSSGNPIGDHPLKSALKVKDPYNWMTDILPTEFKKGGSTSKELKKGRQRKM